MVKLIDSEYWWRKGEGNFPFFGVHQWDFQFLERSHRISVSGHPLGRNGRGRGGGGGNDPIKHWETANKLEIPLVVVFNWHKNSQVALWILLSFFFFWCWPQWAPPFWFIIRKSAKRTFLQKKNHFHRRPRPFFLYPSPQFGLWPIVIGHGRRVLLFGFQWIFCCFLTNIFAFFLFFCELLILALATCLSGP